MLNDITFADIVDSMSEGVLINDPDGRILFVNPALAELLGVAAEAMIGKTIFDFMDAESRAVATGQLERRRQGELSRFPFRWARPDGGFKWTQVAARPYRDSTGAHLGSLVVVTDITKLREAEEALQQAKEDLERRVEERTAELAALNRELEGQAAERLAAEQAALSADAAKTGFLANMSHELRTPLNAILGYAELVQEEAEEDPELPVVELLDDVEKIRTSALHLLALVDDVLDLSKIEAGALDVEMQPFSVVEVVNDAVRMMIPELERHGVALEATVGELPSVIGDARRVRQVLMNLLSNAGRHGRNQVILRAEAQGPTFRIVIQDDGNGVPAAEREQIFKPFKQANGTRSGEGTGLGLAISRSFARMMGGDVVLGEQQAGAGACFTFTFSGDRGETDGGDELR